MQRALSLLTLGLLLTFGSAAWSQNSSSASNNANSMPGMNMDSSANKNTLDQTMNSMSSPHLDMGPHMRMTELRPAQAGDAVRAQHIVNEARTALEKYKDYHVALADGFQIFAPKLPAKMKHFTNYRYAMEAAFHFNPEHPTSLLYETAGDAWKLVGAMYTAPQRFTEDQLNQRVPLSVAEWHQHVNICFPPKDAGREMIRKDMFSKNAQFGLAGSIASASACQAAGGRWTPHLFGWMVHFYPWQSTPEKIWSLEPQAKGMHMD